MPHIICEAVFELNFLTGPVVVDMLQMSFGMEIFKCSHYGCNTATDGLGVVGTEAMLLAFGGG